MSLIAPQDAAFLLGETAAQPTHVAGLAVYELPPGTDPDYVSLLYHELLTHTAIHPRLRRRPADPVGRIGNVWWSEEHDLDLEYHVRLAALPRPGRVRALLELVSRLHGQTLDRHHPLWEFYLTKGSRAAASPPTTRSITRSTTAMPAGTGSDEIRVRVGEVWTL